MLLAIKEVFPGSNVLKLGTMVREYVRFDKMTHLQDKALTTMTCDILKPEN